MPTFTLSNVRILSTDGLTPETTLAINGDQIDRLSGNAGVQS